MPDIPRIVIVGGGFAGIDAAAALRRAPVRVTLIDRRNHHLFQPLLYQVASAALAPAEIAEPIRHVLRRQRNAEVLLAPVDRIDLENRRVHAGERAVPYDYLVLAAGATDAFFGHDDWARHVCTLKTIGGALALRERILLAFERAEWTEDPARRRELMTFVVIGAGPTGVELAGAIAEIATRTLRREFRHVRTQEARVILVEALQQVLPSYPPSLGEKARLQLEALGVQVRLGSRVTHIDASGVQLGDELLATPNVIWAAGVQAHPVTRTLGVPLDAIGRVIVGPDLSLPDRPEVFAVGDIAHLEQEPGRPLPGLAPVAKQMGTHAARNILRTLEGRPRKPFRYRDWGTMSTIGRRKAVAHLGPLHLSGTVAWVVWVFVHLMTLVGFRNRLVVFLQWAWAWVTWDRGSRLIWRQEEDVLDAP